MSRAVKRHSPRNSYGFLSFPLTDAGRMKTHSPGVDQLELSPLSNLLAQPTFKSYDAELSLSVENEDSF